MLETGTVVDAPLIATPSSTENGMGKRKALNKTKPSQVLRHKLEKLKASIRAKVEHPFREISASSGIVRRVTEACQEHQPVVGDVCAEKSVDGAQTDTAGVACMSAPAAWAKAQTKAILSSKT